MVSLSIVASLLFTASAFAQNLINVDSPQPNGVITSKGSVTISYSVIGTQTVNPPYDTKTTYPNSLSVDLVWSEHANPSNVLSLSVSSGMSTDAYPSGLQNIQYHQTWRAPNCHFFSRYPPTTYDFSLQFTPSYPEPIEGGAANVGTEQSKIVVPLSITVDNSTFPKC